MFLIAALSLAALFQFRAIRSETDPKQILPQAHPYIQANRRIEQLFGGGRVIVVGVVAQKGSIFRPALLEKLQSLSETIQQIPGIYAEDVLSLASRRVKHLRFNDQGFDVESIMPEVPHTQEAADELQRRVFSNPLYVGALVSADATAAALVLDIQDRPDLAAQKAPETAGGEPASETLPGDLLLYERLRKIADAASDDTARIHLGGLPVSLAFLEKDTARIHQWVFPLAFALIMLIHYRAFRTFQGMLIPSLTAILSVIWAMGLAGLIGMKLDLWTKGLSPILIVAMASGHSVQILRRFYEELDYAVGMDVPEPAQKTAVIVATSQMAPVTLSAAFVAATSFASLVTFRLPAFQSFGLITAFGILSALTLEMSFIPALRSLIPPPRQHELERVLAHTRSEIFLLRLSAWSMGKTRYRVLIGGLLALVLPLLFAGRIPSANSLRNLFFERTVLRQDDRVLNEKFGGTSTLNLLIRADAPGRLKEPEVMRALEGLQAMLQENPMVGRSESYVDYVKGMRRSFYGGDPEAGRVPETREAAAQFLFLYSVSGNPDDFRRLVDVPYQHAVINTFLKSDATGLARDLIAAIRAYQEKHFPAGLSIEIAGSVPVTLALNEVIIRGKLLNILQMIAVCFVLSSIIFRSFVAGLFVLIPLLIAVSWNFGFLGLARIPLGVSTAAVSAMAVGMGADYAIYVLHRLRTELSLNRHLEHVLKVSLLTAGRAVLLIALAFAAGTLLLSFPGYYLHIEGILMPLAMLSSALAAVILLPAMVITFRPKFMFRVRPSEWIELYTRGEAQKFNVEGDMLRGPKKPEA